MKWLSKAYISLSMAFLYAPIAVLIFFSFNQSKSRAVFTGFTLNWYKELFSNDVILQSLVNTLIIAAVASVAATIIGTAAAIGINGMNRWLKSFVMNVTYLPLINPEIVTGVSLMLLFVFAKVNLGIPLEFGFTTLIIAHITFCIPYVILNVMPKLRQMDIYIYEAALDLGCDKLKAFFKVVLPEIMPGVTAGFLMAFTFSLDDFIISYFNAGSEAQTLPITIFSMTRRKVSPEINAISTIIFVVVLTILLITNLSEAARQRRIEKVKVGDSL